MQGSVPFASPSHIPYCCHRSMCPGMLPCLSLRVTVRPEKLCRALDLEVSHSLLLHGLTTIILFRGSDEKTPGKALPGKVLYYFPYESWVAPHQQQRNPLGQTPGPSAPPVHLDIGSGLQETAVAWVRLLLLDTKAQVRLLLLDTKPSSPPGWQQELPLALVQGREAILQHRLLLQLHHGWGLGQHLCPCSPGGSDSAAGHSRMGIAPVVAVRVTLTVTASDFVFSEREFLLKEQLQIHAAQPPSVSVS